MGKLRSHLILHDQWEDRNETRVMEMYMYALRFYFNNK